MASNELESIRWIKGDELTAVHLDCMSKAIIENRDSIEIADGQINALSKNIQSAALNPYSRHVVSDIGDSTEGNKAYYRSGYEISCGCIGINVSLSGTVGTNIKDVCIDKSLGDLADCDVGKWIVKKVVTDRYGNVNCTDIDIYGACTVPESSLWRGASQISQYGCFYTRIAKIIESPTLVTPSASGATITYEPVIVPFNTNDTPLPIVTVPAMRESKSETCHTVPIIKYNLEGNSVIGKNITNKGGLKIGMSSSSSPDVELDDVQLKSGIELIAGYYSGDYELFPETPEHIEPQPYDITLDWPVNIRTINPDCSSTDSEQTLSLHLKSMDCNNWQMGVSPKGSLTIDTYLPPVLKAGDNITLTQGSGREITISASGGSGGGSDVPLAQYNSGVPNVAGKIAGILVSSDSSASGLQNSYISNGVINLTYGAFNPNAINRLKCKDGVIRDISSMTDKTLLASSTGTSASCHQWSIDLYGQYVDTNTFEFTVQSWIELG